RVRCGAIVLPCIYSLLVLPLVELSADSFDATFCFERSHLNHAKMGCLDFFAEFHENYIRHNRLVQIALAVVFGILFIVIILAISGVFKSKYCPECSDCFYYQFTLNSPQAVCKIALNDKASRYAC